MMQPSRRCVFLTLDKLALTSSGVPIAAEQQHRRPGALVQHYASIGLAQSSQTAKLTVGLLFGHVGELVDERLDPGLLGLEEGGALGQPMAHDGLFDEGLSPSADELQGSRVSATLPKASRFIVYAKAELRATLAWRVTPTEMYNL